MAEAETLYRFRYWGGGEFRAFRSFMPIDMRLTIIILTILFWTFNARSQPLIEYADQRNDMVSYSKVFENISDNWTFVGSYNDENGVGAQNWVIERDPNGNLLASFPIGLPSSTERISSGVLYLLTSSGCDVGLGGAYLRAYSQTGVQLLQRYFPTWWNGPPTLNQIAKGTTDRLALFGGDLMWIVSLNGDSLSSTQLPLSTYTMGTWTSSGELLLAGGINLMLANDQGVTLAQAQVQNAILDILAIQTRQLVLTADRMVVYDPELQPIDTLLLGSELGLPKELLARDGISAIRTPAHLLILDNDLVPIDTISLNSVDGHFITDAILTETGMMTAGYQQIQDRRSGIMRMYDLEGESTDHTDDVELEMLSVDSAIVTGNSTTAHVTVRVTNHSPNVLDNVFMTFRYSPWPWTCGFLGDSFQFNDLALEPGASADLNLTDLYIPFLKPPSTGTWEYDLCVVALSPNHHMDRTTADNIACGNYIVDDVSTMVPEEHARERIWFSPCPVVGSTTIHAPGYSGTANIIIRDLLGRITRTELIQLTGSGSGTIDVNGLRPGRYIVSLQTGLFQPDVLGTIVIRE